MNISSGEDYGPGIPENDLQNPGTRKESQELYFLNTITGIGILGSLLVSIWIFGGFSANEQTRLLTAAKGLDFRLYTGISILFQGKMTGLIALAFGALMVTILKNSAVRGGLSMADFFIRRQFWLIVAGVVNAILFLFSHDLLFHLGIMGILLFGIFRVRPARLLIASLLFFVIYCGKYYWYYADDQRANKKYNAVMAYEAKIKADSVKRAAINGTDLVKDSAQMKKDTLTKDQQKDKGAWEGIAASIRYDSTKDQEKIKAMQSRNYVSLYNHMLPATQSRQADWFYKKGIWEYGSMVLLGMALVGFGFFRGRLSPRLYLTIAILFLTAGSMLGWYRFYYQIESIRDYAIYTRRFSIPYTLFYPFEIGFMTMGYVSLIMCLARSARAYKLMYPFAALGKMGLTSYLMQTILCNMFFIGPLRGYYAALDLYQLYFLVFEIWLVQILFGLLWLRHFDEGPAEWLWRCLIYGKRLPVKRKFTRVPETGPVLL